MEALPLMEQIHEENEFEEQMEVHHDLEDVIITSKVRQTKLPETVNKDNLRLYINESDLPLLFQKLQTCTNGKVAVKRAQVNDIEFKSKIHMLSCQEIHKNFTLPDVRVCISALKEKLQNQGKKCILTLQCKADYVNILSHLFGYMSQVTKTHSVPPLRTILRDILQKKFPKMATNIILATNIFPEKFM